MANVNPYQSAAIKNLAYPAPQGPVVTGLKASTGLGVQKIAQATTNNLTNPQNSTMMDSRVAGAALTQQSGQRALADAGQMVQTSARVGQTALGTQEASIRNQIALRKLSLDADASSASARLARLGEDVKNELLDNNLNFQRDKAGRTLFNERQLADWSALKARGAEELEAFKQRSAELHETKMMMLQQSYKVITQHLDAMTNKALTAQDLETREFLAKAKAAVERKISDETARRAQNASIGRGVGMVVGGVVGAVITVYSGGSGAAVAPAAVAAGGALGASVGGALGEAAGAQA